MTVTIRGLSRLGKLDLKRYQLRKRAEERRRRAVWGDMDALPDSPPEAWDDWLRTLFPTYVTKPFADRHREMWDWLEGITIDNDPPPFIAIWPRGGAKSTNAELGIVRLAARQARTYCWYISETQDQADKHVETIASMLESPAIEYYYPELAQRKVGKYGNSRGWRRQRLRTASGLTIDAMGLDTASRGGKVEADRPDLMVFDDLDGKQDSPRTTQKKIDALTKTLLPAGSNNLAVLGVQNLIIPNGIFSQLADGRAEYLLNRIVSGPHPAVEGLVYQQERDEAGAMRYVITAGEATWEGQDLDVCESQILKWGPSAFLKEAQHDVEDEPGGMYDHLEYVRCRRDDVPDLVRIACWVDPAVTDTDNSDSQGIQIDGIAEDRTVYRLWSWEQRGSPEDVIRLAIRKAVEHGADTVGFEADQGGDLWRDLYYRIWADLLDDANVPAITAETPRPRFKSARAGSVGSKVHRGNLMLTEYERGKFIHVIGTHDTLEKALYRFPKTKPFDLHDAAYWAMDDLLNGSTGYQMYWE